MKKFVKGSLATAGILAVIGCVFTLIGALAGGRSFVYWVKNDEHLAERFEEAGDRIDDITSHIHFGTGMVKETYSVSADEIKNLNLLLGAGEFTIIEKDVSDGVIDIQMEGIGKCSQYVKNDTLYVEGFKNIKVLEVNVSENQIILEIPQGMSFDEIYVEVGAGMMEVSDLKVNEFDAEVGAGELNMTNVETQELSIEIGAGRMEADNVSAKDAEVLAGMGECIYRGTILENLEAECDMGNMEFVLSGNEEDYNYDIDCSAGNIDMDSVSFTALAAERKIDNGAKGNFDISCNMGNISIHFEE